MAKRNGALAIAVCLAAACGLSVLGLRSPEPRYHHHPLSYWTRLYFNQTGSALAPLPQRALADDAIRHIGTNGLPYLLNWFEYDPWPRLDRIEAFRSKLPRLVRTNRFVLGLYSPDPAKLRADAAVFALTALGPEAAPAAPELVRALSDRDAFLARRAAVVLVRMGAPAVPALIAAATNQYNPNRYELVRSIEALGTNGSFAVPVLMSLLQDPDEGIRLGAQTTLNEITTLPGSAGVAR